MDIQQVREIAEAAFKAHFGDIDIVSINIRQRFDDYDDPLVDVKIVYDAEVERLIAGNTMEVRSEIIDKVWRDAEDSPGWPHIHFIAKSDLEDDPV